MAEGASSGAGESGLQVGEDIDVELGFDIRVWREDVNRYRARVDGYDTGNWAPTKDLAIANAFIEVANGMLTDAATKAQDGTRQIVGNDVSSEQLRDTYLGGK